MKKACPPKRVFRERGCKPRREHEWRRGFTFIEMLVTITIAALLMTVGIVSYSSVNKQSRDAKRKSDIEQIRSALELYRADYGYYPNPISPEYSLLPQKNILTFLIRHNFKVYAQIPGFPTSTPTPTTDQRAPTSTPTPTEAVYGLPTSTPTPTEAVYGLPTSTPTPTPVPGLSGGFTDIAGFASDTTFTSYLDPIPSDPNSTTYPYGIKMGLGADGNPYSYCITAKLETLITTINSCSEALPAGYNYGVKNP